MYFACYLYVCVCVRVAVCVCMLRVLCNTVCWRRTYFSTLKVQRHQSKAPEQVSKHAYVAVLKLCGWLFVEAILFNNFSREFCTRIIRACINICIEITVEGNIQISNISTLKRCHLQFTTWCVVPNEIFGPWMSRRGQGRCSNLVKNMLTQNFDAPFEKFLYWGKEEARPEGDIMK